MKPETRKQVLFILDVLMSEYGWSLEYCLGLPGDVLLDLYRVINERKLANAKLWTKLIGASAAAGFSGKLEKLDGIFKISDEPENKEVAETQWKAQLKGLWLRLGKDAEEFESKWAKGEKIEI
jgi:hypothetical protein